MVTATLVVVLLACAVVVATAAIAVQAAARETHRWKGRAQKLLGEVNALIATGKPFTFWDVDSWRR